MTSVLDRGGATSDCRTGPGALTPAGPGGTAGEARPTGLSGLALSLVLVASFMVVLDFSIVNPAVDVPSWEPVSRTTSTRPWPRLTSFLDDEVMQRIGRIMTDAVPVGGPSPEGM